MPTLNAQLAALGGFDQPYDANNTSTLDSLATQAAEVTSHNLIGVTTAAPVAVASAEPSRPDALVIPLLYGASSNNAGRLAGLAVFLRDCAGRVYYSDVADFTSRPQPVASFPDPSEAAAARELGTAAPRLVYQQLPEAAQWCSSSGCIAAGPVYPP